MLKGSAQLRLGDVGGDAEAQDQFYLREANPERVRNPFIPVPEVWTPNDRRCNSNRRAEWHTAQWTFVVPGAQNFVKMLKASTYTYSAWYTGLCVSAWGTLGLKHYHDWHWIPQVRSFISAILFYCTAPPLQIGVGVLLISAFYFLISVIFLHILILSISNYAVVLYYYPVIVELHSACFFLIKLIALATLSGMQLYCMVDEGVLFVLTCWIQINTVKLPIGKLKFPPQCP